MDEIDFPLTIKLSPKFIIEIKDEKAKPRLGQILIGVAFIIIVAVNIIEEFKPYREWGLLVGIILVVIAIVIFGFIPKGMEHSEEEIDKSKPEFKIEQGVDLTKPSPVLTIKLINASKVNASKVTCLANVVDRETGKDVTGVPIVFDNIHVLTAESHREATASGRFAQFEPNREYKITYTVTCQERKEPSVHIVELSTKRAGVSG